MFTDSGVISIASFISPYKADRSLSLSLSHTHTHTRSLAPPREDTCERACVRVCVCMCMCVYVHVCVDACGKCAMVMLC